MKWELDIVIILDVYLGIYGCYVKELFNYFKSIKIGMFIFNGDFIDMWQFCKWYFFKEYIQVIQCILKMVVKGIKVYYIIGNYDDVLCCYFDFFFGNIYLCDKFLFQFNGKIYWIFYGDIFDFFIKYLFLIFKIGGKGYDWFIMFNCFINKVCMAMGKLCMFFVKWVKLLVKEAIKFVLDFEDMAIQLAGE